MMNKNYKQHDFYQLVKNPATGSGEGYGDVVLQLGDEIYDQDRFQRETGTENGNRYAVVRYKDLNGRILYQESHNHVSNIITTLSYNKDASIERAIVQDADDGTVLDISYKDVLSQASENADSLMYQETRELNDITDTDDEIIKTYYGTKLSSNMQADFDHQGNPVLATSYNIKRSDTYTESLGKVFSKKIGRNVSVTAGFSETRCHDKWETCIEGSSYQINCIPSTFSMRHLEDFRMDGHHFVEAVRVVNRLPLVANTISFGPEEDIALSATNKLSGGLLDISFYSLYIEMNADIRFVEKKIRDLKKYGTSITDGGPPPPPGGLSGRGNDGVLAGGGGNPPPPGGGGGSFGRSSSALVSSGGNPPPPPGGGGGSAISRSSSGSSSDDGGSTHEQKSRLCVIQSEFQYASSDITTAEVEHQSMIT